MATDYGATPAYIAAQNEHVQVIAELAKHKVDFNKALNNGVTPAIIAAKNGSLSVIKELAKHNVDFDKAMNNGATPVFLAAQSGKNEVVEELIRLKVNLNLTILVSENNLRNIAESHGANALERAEFLIENKPNKEDKMVAIAPYDIALIMGHTQTALLIANSQKKNIGIAGNSNTLFHSSVSTSQTGGIVLNQDSSYKK